MRRMLRMAVCGTAAGLMATAVVPLPAGAVPCAKEYPAGVVTTSHVALPSPFALAGRPTRVVARVSRSGTDGPLAGRVRLEIDGPGAGPPSVRSVPIRDGQATITLPRDLPARATYAISARFVPPRCSVLMPSTSAPAHYTVFPRSAPRSGR